MSPTGTVYLIPTLLDDAGQEALPAYIIPTVRKCQVLFVENERTTRRFLKALDRTIEIDGFEWYLMPGKQEAGKTSDDTMPVFIDKLRSGMTIGILSEAGCPAVADPGQQLVAAAQQRGALVRPLVGPNSLLLALMASGMNGQQFCFHGYLPIQTQERIKAIRDLEAESEKRGYTQLFIETPYRNNALMEALLSVCRPSTRLCVAADLTGVNENIKTRSVAEWRKDKPELHKKPVIFLLSAR